MRKHVLAAILLVLALQGCSGSTSGSTEPATEVPPPAAQPPTQPVPAPEPAPEPQPGPEPGPAPGDPADDSEPQPIEIVDTDADGLLDDDETDIYGTDPLVADTDGGGTSDGEEVSQGTDPHDPSDDLPVAVFPCAVEVDAPRHNDFGGVAAVRFRAFMDGSERYVWSSYLGPRRGSALSIRTDSTGSTITLHHRSYAGGTVALTGEAHLEDGETYRIGFRKSAVLGMELYLDGRALASRRDPPAKAATTVADQVTLGSFDGEQGSLEMTLEDLQFFEERCDTCS